jgi:hypothetical protein
MGHAESCDAGGIGSGGDTMSEDDVVSALRKFNVGIPYLL